MTKACGKPGKSGKAGKAKLIAARLARVPWWRNALGRIGTRRRREHDEALERLAGRNMTDSVREEDIHAWLAAIETGSRRRPRNSAGS
jgi:hypothetical protein